MKYTASVLGAVWSLLNPIVFLAVFTFVVVRARQPHRRTIPVYLLSGLLAWNLFSVALTAGGAQSVLDNANLVKKVCVPAGDPAAVGGRRGAGRLRAAVAVLLAVHAGLGLRLPPRGAGALSRCPSSRSSCSRRRSRCWVSALNVRYRDVQHLLNLGLLVWFWMTPIVYPARARCSSSSSTDSAAGINLFNLYLLNPLASIVGGFQRALYATVSPIAGRRQAPAVPVLYDVASRGWPACSALTLARLARAALAHAGDCSSGCRATSRRSCDRDAAIEVDDDLEELPAVPREADLDQAAPAVRRARRPRTSGRCATSRSTSPRARRSA